MAIPALMSLTSTVDCSESYMMAHFHAHWMMPLLNCFMGNTGCFQAKLERFLPNNQHT